MCDFLGFKQEKINIFPVACRAGLFLLLLSKIIFKTIKNGRIKRDIGRFRG